MFIIKILTFQAHSEDKKYHCCTLLIAAAKNHKMSCSDLIPTNMQLLTILLQITKAVGIHKSMKSERNSHVSYKDIFTLKYMKRKHISIKLQ